MNGENSNSSTVLASTGCNGYKANGWGNKYRVVYADPPWNHGGQIYNRGGAKNYYGVMNTSEIVNLPIKKYCDWDCACFLWAVGPHLEDAIFTLKGWGFEYKTIAFTWIKTNKKNFAPFFGMGQWTRSNAELCLLGVRGNIKRESASISQVICHPIMEHSKKPDEVADKIVELMGDVPRIELFARKKRGGWHTWGNEIDCDIEMGEFAL
jgi:site-specific DNA-methyltransferase (adenine-specific)